MCWREDSTFCILGCIISLCLCSCSSSVFLLFLVQCFSEHGSRKEEADSLVFLKKVVATFLDVSTSQFAGFIDKNLDLFPLGVIIQDVWYTILKWIDLIDGGDSFSIEGERYDGGKVNICTLRWFRQPYTIFGSFRISKSRGLI